jgi:hypothetical protein
LDSGVTEIQESQLENFNVNDALSNFYKSAVESAARETDVPEADLRNWFDKILITPMSTRSTVFRGEELTGGIPNRAVDFLESQHIIRAEFRAGARWYELTHDRLVEPIRASNKSWFEKYSSLLQKQAAVWVVHGRPDGMLLRGTELEQAEAESQSRTITQDEADFLAACKKLHEREIREKQRNLFIRLLALAAFVALIVAVGFAISANHQKSLAEIANETAVAAVTNASHSLDQANTAKDVAVQANSTSEAARGFVEADRLAGQAQIALGSLDSISLGQLLSVEAYKLNQKAGEILPSVYQAMFDSVEKGQDKILQDDSFSSVRFGSDANDHWLLLDNTLWNLDPLQKVSLVDKDRILETAFRPDGQILVVTGETGYSSKGINVLVKDKAGRTKDNLPLTSAESGYIADVLISEDSNWIVSSYNSYEGRYHGGIQVWNLMNPSIASIYSTLQSEAQGIAITSDGTKVAAAININYSPVVYIFRNGGENLQPLSQVFLNSGLTDQTLGGKPGRHLQFSPNGKWLAVITSSEVVIWGESIPSPIHVPSQNGEEVTGLLFSPDSSSLVYVTSQQCVGYYSGSDCKPSASLYRVMLGASGNEGIQPIIEKSDVNITALDISQNGKLVIGDESGYVRGWDLDTNLSNPFATLAHAGKVVSIALESDNETMISAGENGGTRIWKLNEKESAALTVHRSKASVSNVIRTSDENRLVLSGGYSKANQSYVAVSVISNLKTPQSTNELFLSSQSGSLEAFSMSDQWIAAGRTVNPGYYSDELHFLDLWEINPTNSDAAYMTLSLPAGVKNLAFNQDGSKLAVASSNNGEDTLWVGSIESIRKQSQVPGAKNGTLIDPKSTFETIMESGLGEIQSLLFANNDNYLIGANSNNVHLWDLKAKTEYVVPNAIYPVRMSPDQAWIVTANTENTLSLYPIDSILTGYHITVNTGGATTQFAFSHDGHYLVVATAAGTSGKILIYEFPMTATSQPIYSLQGPTDIAWLELSPNWPAVKWLVAASGTYAYLWNLNNSNDIVKTTTDNPVILQGHRANLLYAGFAGDGKWIMTAAADQTVRFWSMNPQDLILAACAYAGRNFSAAELRTYFGGDPRQTCGGTVAALPEASPTPTVAPTQSSSMQIAIYSSPTPPPTPSETSISYTVKKDDTLSGIAAKYGVSLDTLMSDNGLNASSFIFIGQTLKIRVKNTPVR